jgi:flavin reductase (DIM6/NTAB) family NADH-FMN oxidoreductase RutF
VTQPLAEAMNASCAPVGPEVDEFLRAGLAKAPSTLIAPPRVAASPVSMECRLTQLIRLQRADGQPVDSWLVLGEVVAVHISNALLRDGLYDTAAAQPVLRAGGQADYFGISAANRFQLFRPRS